MARYDDGTMLMGDLVVTEAELPKVTDVLQSHGIDQTALHKHLLEQSPPVWWTHVHAMGDPTQLAQGLRAALDATAIPMPATPPATQPASQPAIDLRSAPPSTQPTRAQPANPNTNPATRVEGEATAWSS
jgi:hypothetical protein